MFSAGLLSSSRALWPTLFTGLNWKLANAVFAEVTTLSRGPPFEIGTVPRRRIEQANVNEAGYGPEVMPKISSAFQLPWLSDQRKSRPNWATIQF